MSCTREKILAQASAWVGLAEADGSHREIVDIYNGHTPRARGYKLRYTDPWCAGFVSACAIACGAADILPTEVSCSRMVALLREKGCWVEEDGYIPSPGDLLFYDWADKGAGDCTGGPDHVGIVEKVAGQTITVIEGNYKNAVKRRVLQADGRYIRGWGVPRYDGDDTTAALYLPELIRGSRGDTVRALQRMLYALGYALGTKPVDGSFGPRTQKAVEDYQQRRSLPVTGAVDRVTWADLLGVAL